MYIPLVSCSACKRHYRVTETTCCPFCSAEIPADVRTRIAPDAPMAAGRLTRAATFAFTTLAAPMAMTACDSNVETVEDGGSLQALYGVPEPTGGAGGAVGDGGGAQALYGLPEPTGGAGGDG